MKRADLPYRETVTINFRYTSYSRQARQCGERLLALTAEYEHLRLPANTEIPLVIELALVARGRHLLRGAHLVADRGDDLGATLFLRSLNECAMTFAWLMIDNELGSLVMRGDEIRQRLNHHRAFAKVERNQRRAAKRRGDPVTPLARGDNLGLLSRADVRRFTRLDAEVRSKARALPNYSKRLKRLGASIASVPSFETRAKKSKNPWLYEAAYRFDSNSAAHPSLLGLQQFVEEEGAEIVVKSAPAGLRPDPYAAGAVLMGALAQLASRRPDHPPIDGDAIAAVEAQIRSFPLKEEP